MSQSDSHATFSGYVALMLFAGICSMSQVGIAGLLMAAGAIYSGACFMNGYTANQPKRRRR
ncbi:hypothetical protein EBZ39_01050 [bacterium]|nr:hypothetical protein [bacterium]